MIFKRKLSLYFLMLSLLTGALFTGRLFFFFRYRESFRGIAASDLLMSFLQGLRFDISTVCIVTVPFVLVLVIPGLLRQRGVFPVFASTLLLWHVVLIGYVFIDVIYYSFSLRHITFEIQNTWNETGMLLKIGLKEYLPESLGLIAFLVMYCLLFYRFIHRRQAYYCGADVSGKPSYPLLRESAAIVFYLLISVLFIRGGFQLKPLAVNQAFVHENVNVGVLSLNGIFSTLDTLYNAQKKADSLAHFKYNTISEADGNAIAALFAQGDDVKVTPGYPLHREYTFAEPPAEQLNVVLLIMESWTGKFIGSIGGTEQSATPYFDRIAAEGMLFKNCLANAQRSVEGLPAVMASLPSWEGLTLSEGGVMFQTRFLSIANIFERYGYETVFLHGARSGSMAIDGMVKRMGFKKHLSMNDFTVNDKTYDGVWGVFDEYVFLEGNEYLSTLPEPFLGVIYTLSSHSPYTVPEGSPSLQHDEHEPNAHFLDSLSYSDYSLGKYFEAARGMSYFSNTVFLITADHTESSSAKATLKENFNIPCLLYSPGRIPPAVIETPVTQVDLIPTLLEEMKLRGPFAGWGMGAFTQGRRVAVIPFGNMFIYLSPPYMLQSLPDRPVSLVDMNDLTGENLLKQRPDVAEALHREFKQYIGFSYKLISDNKIAPAL